MPIFNSFSFQPSPTGPQPSPQSLQASGPILPIQVEVPSALAHALTAAGQPVPQPIDGYALVDTGASITSVDESIFTQLGINPVGIANVGTAGGQQQQSTYPGRFSFPGTGLPGFEHARSLGCNLAGQSALGHPIIALIGRDLLMSYVLVYNGSAGMWSLSA